MPPGGRVAGGVLECDIGNVARPQMGFELGLVALQTEHQPCTARRRRSLHQIDQVLGQIGDDDLARAQSRIEIDREAHERRTRAPWTASNVLALKLWERIPPDLQFALQRAHDVGLVLLPVAKAAAVVVSIVVNAEGDHHDLRIDQIPQPTHQQELLIGPVAGNTGIHDAVPRQFLLQEIGEALVHLDVVAPGERVAQEQDPVGRDVVQLALAQPEAVLPHRRGAVVRDVRRDGVRPQKPAELRIEDERAGRLSARDVMLREADGAQHELGRTKHYGNDTSQYQQATQ